MTDTKELHALEKRLIECGIEPRLVHEAAVELDALRARVAELESELLERKETHRKTLLDLTTAQQQLRKSEEWGTEMKRQANEQSNLANTWMKRANDFQQQLAEAREWIEKCPIDGECKFEDWQESALAAIEAAKEKKNG